MANKVTEIIPQMWQIDSGENGPTVTILGGVHGSEKAGVQVVQNLLQSDLAALVQKGKLNFGIGNPVAVEQGVRFLQGDFDLNRSFGPLPLDLEKTIAAMRAQLLKPIIADSDVLLDLHATIKPSEPMLLSPNKLQDPLMQKLVPVLGIKKVITGKGMYAEDGTGVTTDCYAHSNGRVGITLETGWQEDMTLVPRVQQSVLRALSAIGLSPSSGEVIEPLEIEAYDAYWSVTASPSFAFTQEWENFAKLPCGTHFATRDGVKLKTPCDSFMIFQKPKERIVPGIEACLLLRNPQVAKGMRFWETVQENPTYPRVPEWIRMMEEALKEAGGIGTIGVTNGMIQDAYGKCSGNEALP